MNIYFVISYSEPNSNKGLQFLYKSLSVNIFSKKDAALILLSGLGSRLDAPYLFTTASYKILEKGQLGCTVYKACKAYTCPVLRLKKELWVSDRDINCFIDGGSCKSEAESWSNTPFCVQQTQAWHGDWQVAPCSYREEEVTSYRGDWLQVDS